MGNLVRYISENGGIVVCAIDSTNIVQEMERIHKPSGVVSAALGRLLTGASLMGTWLKNPEDSLTLRIEGDGPIGAMVAVSDGIGNVKGYARNTIVEIPEREDGKLDVGSAVGRRGTLSVVKDLGMKEPYVGLIDLVSGEIAEDITSYYALSEQTPTVCSLGVLVNPDLSIRKAGGFLLQLLPGALEEEIVQIEKNIAKIPSITALLEQGCTAHQLALLALEGFNPNILEEHQAGYLCGCSQQRTEKVVISLGRQELEKMLKEEKTVAVECHFCDKKYDINIEKLLAEM